MLPEVHVFIATSLDGLIATPDGGLEWLTGLPTIEGEDHGFHGFMAGMDALLMGRETFDAIKGFEPWIYTIPVTVLSRSLSAEDLPPALAGRVSVAGGAIRDVLEQMARDGAQRIYADGGNVISQCLRGGLVSRLTITTVPVVLGEGIALFQDAGRHAMRLVSSQSWSNGFVQSVWEVQQG